MRWLRRPVVPRHWDPVLRGAGVVAGLGIAGSWLVPAAAELTVLYSVTLFLNGPYGPLLPAAQEPVVMVFARLYHPALVAGVASAGVTTVEYLNYRLYGAVLHAPALVRARTSRHFARVVRWFNVQPLATVTLVSLTPIPFWLVRIVAAGARYPAGRFLAGNAAGRFLRFWIYGALGLVIPLSSGAILLGGAAVTVVLGAALWLRYRSAAREAPSRTTHPQEALRR